MFNTPVSTRPTVRRSRHLLAATALAATGIAAVAAPASAAAPINLVALGDSFVAGPLTGNLSLSPIGCARSDADYPAFTAKALGATSLKDVSCSGAKAEHVLAAQSVVGGPAPAQINAVVASTTHVTMGFGGNDIGFIEIITGCATAWPFGKPCQNKFAPKGVDSLAKRITDAGPGVGKAIAAVKAKAPTAKVYVVGYPALLPEKGSCWPQMPYTASDTTYLRDTNKRLNAMLQTQAVANGAVYVDVYTPSIGHDACKNATTRWVEPLVPTNPAAPVHPNLRGNQGIAGVVATALRAG